MYFPYTEKIYPRGLIYYKMRLVLIDNRIRDHQSIIDSLTDDTEYVIFEFRSNIESIKSQIVKSYESVAIIQHNYEIEVYRLVLDCSSSIVNDLETVDPTLESWQEYIEFLRWLKMERGANQIDLMACNLWSNPNWRYMIETVRTVHDIYIRASVDITGEGGDFILESDNFDTIGVYFTSAILDYKYSFFMFPNPAYAGYYGYNTYRLPTTNAASISNTYSTMVGLPPTAFPVTSNVISVYANENAIAILKADNTVAVAGGDVNYGGVMPCGIRVNQSNLVNVTKVIASTSTFSALKSDKTVICWGFINAGPGNRDINTISHVTTISVDSVRPQLVNIVDVKTNGYNTYAALNASGGVITWGFKSRGANKLTAATMLSSGVSKIYSGFAMLGALKTNGTACVWGLDSLSYLSTTYFSNSTPIIDLLMPIWGGYPIFIRTSGTDTQIVTLEGFVLYTLPTGVKILRTLSHGGQFQDRFFFVLDNSSIILVNGNTTEVYTNATDVAITDNAYAILQNGTVIVSGSANWGGSLTDTTYWGLWPGATLENVVRLVSSQATIGAMKSDGTFVWWGNANMPSATFPSVDFNNVSTTALYNATTSNVANVFQGFGGYAVTTKTGGIGLINRYYGSDYSLNINTKPANKNIYFELLGTSFVAYYGTFVPLEIPYAPTVTPSSIMSSVETSVSYYVSNPDNMAYYGRKYRLYNGATLIDTFIPTVDTHTYVFSKTNIPTVGTITLDIKDETTITYPVTSFQMTVSMSPMNLTVSIPSTGSKTVSIYMELNNEITVTWGDGNNTVYTAPLNDYATYTYSNSGTYSITIVATNANAISQFGGGNYTSYLTAVNSWGGFDIVSLTNAFSGFTGTLTSIPSLPSTVTIVSSMFYGLTGTIPDITGWNTSNVVDMSYMFYGSNFNQNIGNWNVSNVQNMYRMFYGSSFNQSLGNWKLSNLQNGGGMLMVNDSMSTANINATLYGWSLKTPLASNVAVDIKGYYTDPSGTLGYNTLVNTNGWSFGQDLVRLYIETPVITSVTTGINSLSVALSTTNVGNPAPTYNYSFNGVDICGNSFSSSPIVIPNLTLNQVYTFYIIANNSIGSKVSLSASGQPLVVGSTPIVTSVVTGSNYLTAYFSQSNVGNPAPTYYYSFNGVDISGEGVSSSPILITDLSSTQYTFYIIASNSAGNVVSASQSGSLYYVGTTPVITTVTPQNNSLSVAFTQSDVGLPAPTYYYSFNGTDISGTGVASSPIVIPNLTLSQFYSFYIIASNDAGNVASLSGSGKPLVTGSSPVITSVTPQNNSLSVAFTQSNVGNPSPTYYYSFNGTDVSGTGVSSSPITIPNLTLAQYYTFYIISSNSVGNVVSLSASGQPLVVGSAPQINNVVPGTNKLTVSITDASGFNPQHTTYYSVNSGSFNTVLSNPFDISGLTTAGIRNIQLKSENSVGFQVSNTVSGEPLVVGSAPNIDSVVPGDNKLTVSFTDASGFNPLHTTYYSVNGGSFNTVLSNPFDISGLTTAGSRNIQLKSENSVGFQVSNTVSGEPLVVGSAPTINSVVPGTNKLTVSFTDASGFNPQHTNYYSLDNGSTYPYQVYSNPFDISGLTTATTYYVKLKSQNSVGFQVSNTVSGEPLVVGSAPQINSVVPGDNKLTVSFTDASGFNPQHTTYYSLDNGSTYPYQVPSNPFDISGLTTATTYYVKLKSQNSVGFQVSNTVSGEPLVVGSTPNINSVVPGTNKLTVSFTDASGFNPQHTTYYSLDNGSTYPYQVLSNPFDISGLTTATVYYIKLKSQNSVGFQVSNTVSGEPLVVGSAPNINSIVPGTNKLTVSFTDASGFNPLHTTYYSLDNGSTYPYQVYSNPFDINELNTAIVYYIKLKSENSVGFQISNTVSGEPLVVGSAPNINSVVPGTNKLTVSFTDASGFNPQQTNYYSLDNGSTFPYQVPSNPFDISGLTTATVYFIQIKSENSVGFQVSNTVSGEPLVIGSAPQINTVVPGTNKLTVSFTDASGFNPQHTTYYSVNGGSFNTVLSNPFDISGLTTAESRNIQLKSENSVGFQVSNTVSGEPLVVGSAPTINSVIPGTNKLTVSFTDASGFNPQHTTYYLVNDGSLNPVLSNPFDISGLTTAGTRNIQLKSENSVGFQVSNTVSGEPLVVGSAPNINSVVPGTNKLTVSFTDASGFNPQHTTYYSVNGGSFNTVLSNPFDISGLTTAGTRNIQLKSENSVGFQVSNTVSGEPLVIGSAPQINSVVPGTNKLTVSFTDASGFNPLQTNYYSIDGGSTYPYQVPSNPFDISGLTTAGTRNIQLKSENSVGFQVSNTVSGEPLVIGSAPTINSVVPGTNKLTVSFTDASGFNPQHVTYYSVDNGSTYPYQVPSNPFDISGLTTATVYYVKLKSQNSVGFQVSNTVSGEPLVVGSAPNINSVVPGINKLTVSFTDASGFNPQHTTYYSVNDGSFNTVLSNPFDISGLTTTGTRNIQLKSENSVGFQVSNTVSGEPLIIGTIPQIDTITPATNSLIVDFTQSITGNPLPTYYYSFNGIDISGTGVASSPIVIPNLTLSQNYTFYIIASNSAGNVVSDQSIGKPQVTGSAPIITSVSPQNNSLSVAFTQSNVGNPAPTYYYSFNGSNISGTGVSSSPIVIPNLTLAQYYTFYIISLNSVGNVVSLSASGQPLVVGFAPQINSVVPGTNKLTVSFTDASGFNPLHTTYYSLDNGSTFPYQVYSNPFDISGLTTATVYYIKLKSENSVGFQISNTVSGEPLVVGSAPNIDSIVPGTNKLTVSFTDASGFNPLHTNYYSLDNGSTFPYQVYSNPFDISGLTTATVYYVKLKSQNSVGFQVSNTVSGEPLVIGFAPNINSVVPGNNKLTVSFTDASGFNPLHTTYYSTNNGSTYPYLVPSNPFDISGLTTATVYYIKLKSENSVGFQVSNTVSGEPLVVGSTPQINTVVPGTNKLTVSFTDASGFNPLQTNYYSIDGGSTFPYQVPSNPFDISGLTTATMYYIQIKSENSVGFQVSNTVSGEPLVVGSAPQINTVVPGTNKLTVSFTDASGFNPQHTTYYSLDNGSTYPYQVPSNPFDISGLTTATVYYIKLKSENSVGFQVSNTVSGEPLVVGSAPNINSVVPGNNKLTVSFTDASGFNPQHTTYYSMDNGSTYPYLVPSNPFDISGLTTATVYYVKLKSENIVGFQVSNTVSGEPLVIGSAPTINSVVPGTNKLTVSFTDASGFNPQHDTYYSVNGGSLNQVFSNPFDISGLTTAGTRNIQLKSQNSVGFQVSNTVSGEPLVVGYAPQINSVVPGNNKLTVSFTDASGFNPQHTTYYSVNGGSLNSVLSNPFDISGLTTAGTRNIQLRSENNIGFQVSNTVSGEPLVIGSAPTINSVVPGINKLTVSFTDASGFNPLHTTYYSVNDGSFNTVLSNPFDISGLTTATTYFVKLKSENSVGFQLSNTVSGEPLVVGSVPQINSVTSETNSLSVAFTQSITGNPAPTYYYSFNGTDESGTGVSSSPIIIPNLTIAQYYTFYIIALNSAGNVASLSSSGIPNVIGTAATITSVTPGLNSLSVAFTDSSGSNPAPTYYYSFNGTTKLGSGVSASPLTIPNLTEARDYIFYIIAENSAGNVVSLSASGEPYAIGSKPVITGVTPQTNSLSVAFTQSNDGNPAAVYYYSFDGVTPLGTSVSSSPIVIPNLTLSQNYTFYIIASNTAGIFVSNQSSGKPLVTGSAPVVTSVTPASNSLSVAFTQSNVGNPAPTYYYSFNGVDPSGTGVSASPIVIPNLTEVRYYTFYIISSNSVGNVASASASGEPLILGSKPVISSIIPGINQLAVNFTQSIRGNPLPTYYYSFNGVDLSGTGSSSSPITISNLMVAQTYTIYIIASNSQGNVVSDPSNSMPFVIGSAPVITNVASELNRLVVDFSGSVGSFPAPTYYYSFNGVDTSGQGVSASPIVITDLSMVQYYTFYIIASNIAGNAVSDLSSGRPYILGTAPVITSVTPLLNSLSVGFTGTLGGNPAAAKYYYSFDGITPVGNWVFSSPIVIPNLTQPRYYTFYIISSNSAGNLVSSSASGEPLILGTNPVINSITPIVDGLTITFTDSSGGNPTPDTYYSLDGGSTYPYLITSKPTFTINVNRPIVYYISLKSTSTAGNLFSNTVSGEPFLIGTMPVINNVTASLNKLTVSYTDGSGYNPAHTTYYSMDNGETYPYLAPPSPFDISGLTTAITYYIRLRSSNSAGFQLSNIMSGKPLVVGSAPQINSVVPGTNQLTVSFTDASGFNPLHATYYSLDNGITYPYLVSTSPSFIIPNLTSATVYYIKLKSMNSVGFQVSNTVSGEPLVIGGSPVLKSVTPGINSLTVSYTEPTGFNPVQTTYYSTDGGATYPNIVPSNPFTIPGLSNRVYSIKLRSSNNAGDTFSGTISEEPYYVGSSPTINTLTPGTNRLTVSFTDAYGFNPKHTTYYSTDGGATYPSIVPSNPFTLPGLLNRVYYISLKSVNIAGNLVSITVSGEPNYSGTSPSLNTLTPGLNSLTVSFTDATGFNPTQTTYYSIDGGATYPYIVSSNPFTIPGLLNRLYYIKLRSTNIVGNTFSNTLSRSPYYIGNEPVINTVTPGTNRLIVSFTDATGFNPTHTTYYSIDGGVTYPSIVPSNPFTIYDLLNRVYYISLKSENSVGNLVSNTIAREPYYVGNSAKVDTLAPGTNSLTVFFTDATGFNPAHTNYYSIDGGATYPRVVPSNPFTINGLSNRVYYISLKSTNSAGNVTSDVVSGEPNYIGNPPTLSTLTSGTNSLTVSFTDATGFNPVHTTYYSIDRGSTYPYVVTSNPFTIPNLANRVYYISLRSVNTVGSLTSGTLSRAPNYVGNAPSLNSLTPSANSITVSFTDAAGFNPAHTTYYSIDGGATYPSIVPSNPFTLSNLSNRLYYIKLRSVNIAGNLVSDTLSSQPYYVGSEPVLNSLTPGLNSLIVSFTDASGFNPLHTTYFSINGGTTYPFTVQSNPFTITGLTGISYSIKLKSSNSIGFQVSNTLTGSPSSVGIAPVLNPLVSGLNSLTISFKDATGFNPVQTTYYSTDGGKTYPNVVPSNPFTLFDLSGMVYSIQLKSSNDFGFRLSNIVSGEPYYLGTAPRINYVEPGKNRLVVGFTESVGGNPLPTYYYSVDSGATYNSTPVTSSPFAITGLTTAGIYYVKLNATSPVGNVFSNTVSGEPFIVGTKPVIRTITPGVNSLSVQFSQSRGGNPEPKYYYSLNGVDLSGEGVYYSQDVTIPIPNLTLSQFYTVYIIASNSGGNAVSDLSLGKPLILGSAPVINDVTPGLNNLTVGFTQTNLGNPAPLYYYSFNGVDLCGNGVASSPIVIPDLTVAQYYTFYIISTNTIGNVTSLSASGEPYIIGSAPEILDASSILNGLVIRFNGSVGGNPPPESYYYSLNGGDYIDSGSVTSPITITGLTEPSPYSIRLKARNFVGDTSASDPFSGTPYVIGTPPVIYNISSGINRMTVYFNVSTRGYPAPIKYFYSIDGIDYIDSEIEIDAENTTSSIIIPELTKFGPYNVTLIAYSLAGYTETSNIAVGRAYVVGDAPTITELIVNFNDFVMYFSNGGAYPVPTEYYYSIDDVNYLLISQTDATPLRVDNLVSNSSYILSLYSSNFVGNSPIVTVNIFTQSQFTFFARTMNPKYNLRAPIYIGPQPKSDPRLNGGSNQTAVSTRAKFSRYVGGTAGSRR